MSFPRAVQPPKIPKIPIGIAGKGKDAALLSFPVHRIYCVGKNYSAHIQEMGGDPKRDAPCFFTKPPDAIVPCDVSNESSIVTVEYPLATKNLHHEIELVVAIGKGGTQIPINEALNHVYGYGVAVDLTRRDLQSEAKKKGLPWDSSKAFDQSAPISNIYPVDETIITSDSVIWLEVNGETKQKGVLGQMVWSVPEIVSTLSSYFRLVPGDLILTGTPAGVGPIQHGQTVTGGVEGIGELAFTVA